MDSLTLELGYPAPTGSPISSSMFSANLLFKINTDLAAFDQAISRLHIQGLRFPGGSMTEQSFDINNPDQPLDDTRAAYDNNPKTIATKLPDGTFVKFSDFMAWCYQNDCPATIVLPTRNLLAEIDISGEDPNRVVDSQRVLELKAFVRNVLATSGPYGDIFADVKIKAFEIGNEYWGSGEMTAVEYGRVANAVSQVIAEVIAELGGGQVEHPQVLVQMGGPWSREFDAGGVYDSLRSDSSIEQLANFGLSASDFGADGRLNWQAKVLLANLDIIKEITDPDAHAAISGLVEHYYTSSSAEHFELNSQTVNYINRDVQYWSSNFKKAMSLHITEWNIAASNYAQLGLKGAGLLLEQFENMLKIGMDSAFVWAVQHNTANDLAGKPGDSSSISPLGAAFNFMAESLVGARLVPSNITGGDVEINAFESAEACVLFVISRSRNVMSINLNAADLARSYDDIVASKIGVDLTTADGLHYVNGSWQPVEYFNEHDVKAFITQYTWVDVGTADALSFSLDPFEVLRITFLKDVMTDFTGTKFNDTFVGRYDGELIEGMSGADLLYGKQGNDHMRGGNGGDTIVGGAGSDWLEGEVGNDLLIGDFTELKKPDRPTRAEAQPVISGNGMDSYRSKDFGSPGFDRIYGGRGNDTLMGGGGDDYLHGGEGVDTFVFSGKIGSDRIADFDPSEGGDVIDFSRVESISSFQDLFDGHIRQAQEGVTISISEFGNITLLGVELSSLSELDFIF
jgi:hypothetical protein